MRVLNVLSDDLLFRGPENEGGVDASTEGLDSDVGGGDVSADDVDTGTAPAEPDKPLSVREQLKKSIAEVSEAESKTAKPAREKSKAGQRPGKIAAEAAPAVETPASPEPTGIPAPESLTKEAKAEWDKAPKAIQEAFVKREQDMANGVAELKQRYGLIDQALAPHQDALRQMNATPGEAVNRLFLWFKALAGSPIQSFPELAKSMGYDWNKVVAAIHASQKPGQQQPQPGQQQPGAVPEIPEPVKNYIGQLEQQINRLNQTVGQIDGRFNTIQQDVNAQNEAKTRENLSIWSKDKEFYEEVRQDMAALLQSGMIPLKAGQVDLDTAYERAIYYNPDVRAKVLAKQQQANQQVQQQTTQAATTAREGQVAKARKAAVSLPVGSPGAGNATPAKQKPGQKMSVRDSLKAAMAELRDQ